MPLLGVCLGHQGLTWVHGGKVLPAPEVMHGRISAVLHETRRCSPGIPREFQAVRYHSLCVEQPLPEELEVIARTSDGVVMAVAHRTRPQWGVQFHPESICTDYGRRLLANFRELTEQFAAARGSPSCRRRGRRRAAAAAPALPAARTSCSRSSAWTGCTTPNALSSTCYGASETAFWLDSSKVDERARFSFMGAADGPLRRRSSTTSTAASCACSVRGLTRRSCTSRSSTTSAVRCAACATSRTTCRSTSTAASSATSATS